MSDSAEIKHTGSKDHDQSMVKVCNTCGKKYHPRRNSYQITSRFCDQECARKGRRIPSF